MKSSNALRMIAKAIRKIVDEDVDVGAGASALYAFSEQIDAVAADLDEAERKINENVFPRNAFEHKEGRGG